MSKALKISQIDLSKISYETIKGKDKKYIPINYINKDTKLIFQTPELLNNSHPVKCDGYYELDIPLYGKSSRKVDKLVKLFNSLDNKFIEDAKKNAKEWFSGKNTIRYKSIIRNVNDRNVIYDNGVIKIKILYGSEGTVLTQGGKEIDISDLNINTHFRLLLEVSALWLSDNGFGLYLKTLLIDQAIVKKYIFTFVESDSDSDIIGTEMGPNEDGENNKLFIKDSDSVAIEYNPDIAGQHMIIESNSDRLLTEHITETNDESVYETSTMISDFNNMKKMINQN